MSEPGGACPTTVERIVVEGANDVCGPPWSAAPAERRVDAALAVVIAAAFAAALVRRAGLSRRSGIAFVLAVAASGAAGIRGILVDRADAPLRAPAAAKAVTALVGQLDGFVSAHGGCVASVRDDCLACQPILRFVSPDRPPCDRRTGSIQIEQGALDRLAAAGGGDCSIRGETMECAALR